MPRWLNPTVGPHREAVPPAGGQNPPARAETTHAFAEELHGSHAPYTPARGVHGCSKPRRGPGPAQTERGRGGGKKVGPTRPHSPRAGRATLAKPKLPHPRKRGPSHQPDGKWPGPAAPSAIFPSGRAGVWKKGETVSCGRALGRGRQGLCRRYASRKPSLHTTFKSTPESVHSHPGTVLGKASRHALGCIVKPRRATCKWTSPQRARGKGRCTTANRTRRSSWTLARRIA
jgi:hypothetical protein